MKCKRTSAPNPQKALRRAVSTQAEIVKERASRASTRALKWQASSVKLYGGGTRASLTDSNASETNERIHQPDPGARGPSPGDSSPPCPPPSHRDRAHRDRATLPWNTLPFISGRSHSSRRSSNVSQHSFTIIYLQELYTNLCMQTEQSQHL